IKEGFYPNKTLLKFTKRPKSFPLLDEYEVIIKWEREKSNTVKYFIHYKNSKPVFRIYYGDNFDQMLETTQSCTNEATQIQKILHPDNNSLISGILLFSVQLQVLKTAHEKRIIKLKPYENLSNYCYNSEDELTLNSIKFSVSIQKDFYQIDFSEVDKKEIKLKHALTVKAIDQKQISQDGYRTIISLSNNLIKEWAISEEKVIINKEMQEKIPISIIKLDNNYSTESFKIHQ
ncbi:2343_t:CDS:2, partial [Funneliformis caledonium]